MFNLHPEIPIPFFYETVERNIAKLLVVDVLIHAFYIDHSHLANTSPVVPRLLLC